MKSLRVRRKQAARMGDGPAIVKAAWKPGTMLNPVPAVMVSCVAEGFRPNIITVAWAGTVCSEPPMLSISARAATHSHGLIMASKYFVVNVPSARQIKATDYCGVVSGRDVDKFEAAKLTPAPALVVPAPIILECPINIECEVRQILELGSHTMFIAEIVAVQVTESLISTTGRFELERAGLAAYAHGGYYVLGKKLGHFGYSVKKPQPEKE